jgi:hypothetical protein
MSMGSTFCIIARIKGIDVSAYSNSTKEMGVNSTAPEG